MSDYRLRYEKRGPLRYISHLDIMRAFERAFRRASLPIAYTEGFHPHPQVGLGPALTLGIESTAEYMDLSLTEDMEPQQLSDRLNQALPPELHVDEVKMMRIKAKPLTAVINRATYMYDEVLGADRQALEGLLQKLWNGNELWVTRRSKGKGEKEVNIRPLWYDWQVQGDDLHPAIQMEFAIGNQGNVRPDEILKFFPENIIVGHIARTGLWVVNEHGRFLPSDFTG
jgi:radical SAM-linked protein